MWDTPYRGLVIVLTHTEVRDDLAPFEFGDVLTRWEVEPALLIIVAVMVGCYTRGVITLRRRGDRWPWPRSLAAGVAAIGLMIATHGGLAVYDTTLLSVHMVQHMVLSMLVPLAMALSAPVTLLLRLLSGVGRRRVAALLHSWVARLLAFPPLTFGLFVVSPWVLYFTGWYPATIRSTYLHDAMHLHLVLVGALFFWPLVGVDPVPGRPGYPLRMLTILLTLPFHAFLGVTMMGSSTLIARDWYASLRNGPMAAWLPSVAEDQRLAGGILWASGDVVGLVVFLVLFAQWARASHREAEREDRRLDLIEARARRDYDRH
jgi:cytochrome c oxidase assembly factor CtaG